MPATRSLGAVLLLAVLTLAAPVRAQAAAVSWSEVIAGSNATCAIRSDRTLWCWGRNGDGQIGDGTKVDRNAPAEVAGDARWTAVALGSAHTCGIRTDGSMWCWGANTQQQLGLDTDDLYRSSPARVGTENGWTSVSSEGYVTCATRTDHSLRCWGSGTSGMVIPADDDWASVSVGGYHVCGVRTDATLWCWDERASSASGTRPVRAGTKSNWRSVSAGLFYTCGVDTGDALWCWGRNLYGELGDGTTGTERAAPTRIAPENRWSTVRSGGALHTCGLDTGGRTWCWGENDRGQIGDGTTRNATVPAPVNADLTWKAISPGGDHTCALSTGDALWCWGDDSGGQLGDGPYTTEMFSTTPLRVGTGTGTGWDRAAPAADHTCALRTDDSLWCWGANSKGELGDGTTTERTQPAQVLGGKVWQTVAAYDANTCGLRTDGGLWCWGEDFGDQNRPGFPRRLDGTTTWSDVSVAANDVCGLRSDGTVWCWDAESPGKAVQAGPGAGEPWTRVTIGNDHTCTRDTAGVVSCWGSNYYGQLGDGDLTTVSVPKVGLGRPAATVESGSISTCAIGADRSLWCWGGNRQGQVGDGDTMDILTPVRVGGAADWTSVSIGNEYACGTRTDASLWCWGDNYRGQLGDGSLIERHAPVRIDSKDDAWLSVGTGLWHSCGVRTDRSLWCWGANDYLQLGATTITRRPVPVPAT